MVRNYRAPSLNFTKIVQIYTFSNINLTDFDKNVSFDYSFYLFYNKIIIMEFAVKLSFAARN